MNDTCTAKGKFESRRTVVIGPEKWDERMFQIADAVSTWSKDRSTKVGAVICDDDFRIKATGYNGFPRGVLDDVEMRYERPEKYLWTVHSELNAILSCEERPVGMRLYCNLTPCMGCAGAIAQSGIKRVYVDRRRAQAYDGNYTPEFAKVETLFQEANVGFYLVERPESK